MLKIDHVITLGISYTELQRIIAHIHMSKEQVLLRTKLKKTGQETKIYS